MLGTHVQVVQLDQSASASVVAGRELDFRQDREMKVDPSGRIRETSLESCFKRCMLVQIAWHQTAFHHDDASAVLLCSIRGIGSVDGAR